MSKISLTEKIKLLSLRDPSRDYDSISEEQVEQFWRQFQGGLLLQKISRQSCNAGWNHASKFEDICKEICEETLEKSFKDHVVTAHSRTLKINGSERRIRDINFPNHPVDEHNSSIWNIFKKRYKVQSFVMECKNYLNDKISSKEIYKLFEYLDPDEHGRLGFFLTREGEKTLDNSARTALARLKREEYKFIVLGDVELREWITCYIEDGSPERFFNKLLDNNNGKLP